MGKMEINEMMAKIDWQEVLPKFFASIIILLFVNFIRLFLTLINFQDWYIHLNKPFFAIPNSYYEPIWIILFIILGISIYIIWHPGFVTKGSKLALYYFIAMILFTLIWAGIFFSFKTPIGGLILSLILTIITILTIWRFLDISRNAGILLIPYLIWTIYLSILELGITLLN